MFVDKVKMLCMCIDYHALNKIMTIKKITPCPELMICLIVKMRLVICVCRCGKYGHEN